MLPALRGGGVVEGGPAAAVVYRNDLRYLAAKWCAAAYVHGSALEVAVGGQGVAAGGGGGGAGGADGGGGESHNPLSAAGSHPLMSVVAPLTIAGDAALQMLMERGGGCTNALGS